MFHCDESTVDYHHSWTGLIAEKDGGNGLSREVTHIGIRLLVVMVTAGSL
jgi:hypothetical protein